MAASPFGEYVREARVGAGKSLREVAEALGVTHAYLSQVERGKTTPLTEDKWPALLEILPVIERDKLKSLAAVSRPVSLDLSTVSKPKQELGLLLARRLEEMPNKDVDEILKILRGVE